MQQQPGWRQFEDVLSNFTNSDERIRNQAEDVINKCATEDPNGFVVLLVQNIAQSTRVEIKHCAAVLFYKMCFTSSNKEPTIWFKASLEVRNACKLELLNSLKREQVEIVGKTICECICEIMNLYLNKKEGAEDWPQLAGELFQLTQSPTAMHRQSAYFVFSSLPSIFGENNQQYLAAIHDLLQNAMGPNEADLKVKVYAMRATAAFILAHQKPAQRDVFVDMTGQMFELMVNVHSQGDNINMDIIANANAALQALVNIATHVPVFFRPNLRLVFQHLLTLVNNRELDVHTRALAVEVLVTLAEKRSGMIRKLSEEGQECDLLIQSAFGMMIDVSDDVEAWSQVEEIADAEEEEVAELGEQVLDRLSRFLGGKTILPSSFRHISELLTNPDWRYRHAALKGIAAIGEGGQKQIAPQLESVVNMILQFLVDPHPRVRYAACHALGQLSTDMHTKFQNDFHSTVLPGLLQCMGDSCHRVQAHAAAALVNFSEHATKEILQPYLNEVSFKLYNMLNSNHRMVLEQAIMSIAIVADSSGSLFSNYYGEFMPVLKNIFQRCVQPSERLLRGKTLECMSFIGLAVKDEQFENDAVWIMETLHRESIEKGPPKADDPQVPFLLAAHGRICKTLGKGFVRYLPSVLPPLLETAKIKPELSITAIDAVDQNAQEDSKEWDYLYMQNYKIGIKSSTLEDKCTACEMIVLYVESLKEGFAPYLTEVAEIMIPLVEFYYHEGVRIAAAECLPHLLTAAISAQVPDEYLLNLWNRILEQLLKALKTEDDTEMAVEFLFHFKSCIEVMGQVMGADCLTDAHLCMVGEVLNQQFEQYFKRVHDRIQERKDVDYDEGVEEDLGTHDVTDELFIAYITDLVNTLFSTLEIKALRVFDIMIPTITRMLQDEQVSLSSNKVFALCVFSDLIRFCGDKSLPYVHNFCLVDRLIHAVQPTNQYNVRRFACFAMGVIAQYGGAQYAQANLGFVQPLLHVISEKSTVQLDEEKKEEYEYVYENAVAAIGKICRYSHGNINGIDGLLSQWIHWLPITEDEEECYFVYDYLCHLIENNNQVVMGANNANGPFLAGVLNTVLTKKAIPGQPEIENRCKMILQSWGVQTS